MKRVFDFFVSIFILLFFFPLILLVSFFVRWKLGSPVLFKQIRPGINGKPFEMLKFRTMEDTLDNNGQLLPDEDRLNAFGKALRSTSIDELPGLISVIKGDMSLIGPRPLLMQYLPLYTKRQAIRQNVRPGITGWAQVNGRNAITWEQKFEYDVWYVENQSFILDFKILFLTVKKVICREDISATDHVTMTEFKGSDDGK